MWVQRPASAEVPEAELTPILQSFASVYASHAPPPSEPLELNPGPHLFLDERLIESSSNVQRQVCSPERDSDIPNPVVTGIDDGCFQPYLTVMRDASTRRFRMWYGRHTENFDTGRSRIGYTESPDGIHWERPARTLDDPAPIQFGVSVVDALSASNDPSRRYVYAWYINDGLKLATSPDGIAWTALTSEPVIKHNHDITGLWYDDARKRFTATLSVYRESETWSGKRRITMHAHSTDLLQWSAAHYVVLPDSNVDDGEMQFYAMDGYLRRGDLLIGMVKVLRDDLKADNPPDPPDAYGVGYTALAWSHDGEHWVRDIAHFFDPNPAKAAWDHAHAWIDEQVPVGDNVYLYYGGYARGHKVNRFEERQIGLAPIKRDRYVARSAGSDGGSLTTRLVVLRGTRLTVNADAADGEIRVAVLDSSGQLIPGYGFENCAPIRTDSLDAPLAWKRNDLTALHDRTIRLSFSIRNARLFALGIE